MSVQIQIRRGTAAAWTTSNPTLAQGELGVELDTAKLKVGDGSTAWASLAYLTTGGGGGGSNGADGKTVRNGSGAPSSGLGVDGDFYIDTTGHTIYGPKASGAWGSPTSLIGPTGSTGVTGSAGPNTVAGSTSTTFTGILKGNGSAVGTATAGTDYLAPAGSGSALTGITAGQVSGLAAVATSGSAADLGAGTLAAARLPALTGDVTSSAGSSATTLGTSGVTAGTYGDATHVAAITVDDKGRVTAASAVAITGGGGGGGGIVAVNTQDFRLTTESGVPASTTDRTAQSTVYLTPAAGNQIALYDGSSSWTARSSAELSISLTGGLTSAKNYDVFAYWTGSAVALELSAAWSSDTTRTDALTTQDGVWVKSGATTRRYLGTFRTTGTSTTEDSSSKRFLWNLNHRTSRKLLRVDSTSTWTYAVGTTYRQARGSTSNQVEAVVGLAGSACDLLLRASYQTDSGSDIKTAIGMDSTIAPSGDSEGYWYQPGGSYATMVCREVFHPTAGYHFWAWLEYLGATATIVFNGGSKSGLMGTIDA